MLHTLEASSWTGPFSHLEQEEVITALENGKVVYLPQLSFPLETAEQVLLSPKVLEKGFKNISFSAERGSLKGGHYKEMPLLTTMMSRFFKQSRALLESLIPHYQKFLINGRTSYRPIEILGRKTSLLKDDTRLHVDAFPATPNQGKRILRVFTNINPNEKSRVWHLGEPFENVVEQFLPALRKPWPGVRKLLSLSKITRSPRSLYDHYMLMLHDNMKKSNAYQANVKKTVMPFPAGATWVVMTDAVSHAALSGQFLLEQTFYLEVSNMLNPQHSPLKVLERALHQKLVDYT